jgi:hypothetical protein
MVEATPNPTVAVPDTLRKVRRENFATFFLLDSKLKLTGAEI